jgi:hypothetical protein
LIDRLHQVSIAITEGVTDARTLESLIFISRNQDDLARRFRAFYDQKVLDLLKELTQPK